MADQIWPGTPRQPQARPSAPAWPGTPRSQPDQPSRPRRRPRRMRAPEERANDPTLSEAERERARGELARPTQASPEVPARQENVRTPTRSDGTLSDVLDAGARLATMRFNEDGNEGVFERAGRFLTGQGRRDTAEPVREARWQSVPERDDVQWQGGMLSEWLNSLPQPVRTWLDAEGRAARIGTGFFLNPDENDRAEILRANIPEAEFRRDEYGNVQVRFAPHLPWAFMNAPGASVEDATTTAETLARYAPAARISAVPQLFASRAAVAGVTSAATEYASQRADDVVGGPEGVDMGRVGEAGLYGAGGQVAFDAAAAGVSLAAPAVRRALGVRDTRPLRDPNASGSSASEAYGAPPRNFQAERQAVEQRAQADRAALDEQTFNGRVMAAADIEGNARDVENAGRLTAGQERVIDDHIRRVRRVEQERRAALARLDNEEFGMNIPPPAELNDLAKEAMSRNRPVYVATPNGVRRVSAVYDEGFIDEAGEHVPSAGLMPYQTDDGLLFEAPPRPQPRPPEPEAAPTTQNSPNPSPSASDIYERSDEFGIPVSRGEARQDVVQRTNEFDMLHGRFGPGAQRQAADFQDQRARALETAGRNIATRNQEPLANSIDDAGQIIQNQVRDRWHTLTQEINKAYHEAMTALADIPVNAQSLDMLEKVERRLRFGRGNLDDPLEDLVPITGYDPDIIRTTTKSRAGTALRMIENLQDAVITRANNRRGQFVRFSYVERVRQRLLEMQQDAIAANDPDAYAMDLIVEGFDDWLGPALQRPPQIRITSQGAAFEFAEQQRLREQASAAIQNARRLHAQRESLFTRQGAGDFGGRTMENIRSFDTSGTQIINQILGAGRVPPSQARAAVERIVEIANRSTAGGQLAAKGEATAALRRFEGGTAHPVPEIQALREALFMRIMEPLRVRGQGNQVPIQSIVTNLDTAINGPGRSITAAMFTPDELATMERLLSVLRYYVPTSASRPTGVMAARLLGASVDAVTRFITGAPGMAVRGLLSLVTPAFKDASGDFAASEAFRRLNVPDGLPTTQSGSAFGQLMRENGVDDSGAAVPLEPPPSSAAAAYEIDPTRQPLSTGDGEGQTLTIEVDGQFLNIPTFVNGRQLGARDALSLFERGENQPLGRYGTEDEALAAARSRRGLR